MAIGIVDTGINTANTEFAGRISNAAADVAGSRGLIPENDHGTMVALVAAAARNDSGIMGIAYEATIMMMRADSPGSCAGGSCGFYDSAIVAGVDRAVQNGAKVINLSLGGSSPSNQLMAAIGRAASAGVVIVVAAGNAGTANPDPFATGLRQAGNGNVIIAGSVSGSGVVSSFSDRAGSEANAYLMAMGQQVCCTYSGSNIAVTTINGQQYISYVNGTSFAAPQIAGAVALLRQAFPNLTAAQTVDLLLSSARDAGTAGTDAIYGRGILDIGNAFAPRGSMSLAGNLAPLQFGETTAVMSFAMGDAAINAPLSAMMLDSYQRAYRVDLSHRVVGATADPRLGQALLTPMESISSDEGAVSLGFAVDRQGLRAGQRWTGLLRLSHADAESARVLAARVAAKIAPNTRVAFGFAQGADGLVAQVRGHSEPAFIVARSTADDFGFTRSGQTSVAIRQNWGSTGMTLLAERGSVQRGFGARSDANAFGDNRDDLVNRFGLALDRKVGPVETSIGLSWLAESRTVLGARLHNAFGARGANSLFFDLSATVPLARNLRLGGAWRHGYTNARSAGLIAPGSRLSSDAWSIDVVRNDLFAVGDSLALRFSQPLRVRSGGLNLSLPVAYDYDTLTAMNGISQLGLAPTGREITGELAWRGPLWGGSASTSLFYRHNPGNYSSLPADKGVAVSWKTAF